VDDTSPFFQLVNIAARVWGTFRQSLTATIGLSAVILLILTAIFAPYLAPYDPVEQELTRRTELPSADHLLGTDRLGRDILSRIIVGTRLSLTMAVVAVAIGTTSGVTAGLVSGYAGGIVDNVLMRLVDILLAFPLYILAIAIMAILGPSLVNMMIAVGISSFPRFARLSRGEVRRLISLEYIEACRALGIPTVRVLFHHILPNIANPVVVLATLRLGTAVLVESSLSFLGLGPPPPTPTWGLMVSDGLNVMRRAPFVSVFPGLAIMLLVLSFNLLGDGLRDALDPRTRD